MGDYAERWITTTLDASDRKPATQALYATLIRTHVVGSTLGAMPISRVRKQHVDGWQAGLKRKRLAESTRRSCFVVLSTVFADAVSNELLARNVVSLSKRPVVEPNEAVYLTAPQVKTLLTAANGRRATGLCL